MWPLSRELLCEKVEGTEGVGAARRGGPMGTIVSRPTGKEYGAGGFRGGVDCIEAMVSGLWCRGSSCGGPLCRGYRVGAGGRGCCEVRDDVKKMMGGGFGGVNGRFCGPKGQWS